MISPLSEAAAKQLWQDFDVLFKANPDQAVGSWLGSILFMDGFVKAPVKVRAMVAWMMFEDPEILKTYLDPDEYQEIKDLADKGESTEVILETCLEIGWGRRQKSLRPDPLTEALTALKHLLNSPGISTDSAAAENARQLINRLEKRP